MSLLLSIYKVNCLMSQRYEFEYLHERDDIRNVCKMMSILLILLDIIFFNLLLFENCILYICRAND